MILQLNGESRHFVTLGEGTTLARLVQHLELKSDRIAIEHNGVIAARGGWQTLLLRNGDKLEIVHFVGGGS